jgi:hypothetical protein
VNRIRQIQARGSKAVEAPGLDQLGRFVRRRELARLERALGAEERLLHVLEAQHGRRGVLAATDRRLLFIPAGMLRRKPTAWPYAEVVGLKVVRAVDDAVLRLTLRAGEAQLTGCRKAAAEALVRAVQNRPPGPDDPLDFTPPGQRPKTPRQQRREQLDRMLQKGSITKAEHDRMVRSLDDT